MKTKLTLINRVALLVLLSTMNHQLATARAQGTAFTYQGRLNDAGVPASGSYDFRFRLASDPLANNYVGSADLTNGLPVMNGLFTTTLDFGPGVLTGSNYWLEVDVRTNGAGSYTVLAPLQALTPTPYAIMANSASNLLGTVSAAQISGTVDSANLAGTYANALTLNNAGNSFSGSFSGNGANVTALNANNLASGTVPLAQLPSTVITDNETGVTLGGTFSGDGSGLTNLNAAQFSSGVIPQSVLPGFQAGNNYATVDGGSGNAASGQYATVPGGVFNYASGARSVAGGSYNSAIAYGATVSGGNDSTASGYSSTVAGGENNAASGGTTFATGHATVGGGYNNSATGAFATVPGGSANTASGQYSFAAGQQAKALNQGAFVWADSQNAPFSSTNNDSFNVRAQGGVRLVTSGAGMTLDGIINGNGGVQVGAIGTAMSVIQSGQAIMPSSSTVETNFTVTFPHAFSSTPKVIASISGDPGYLTAGDTFAMSIRAITSTTGFTVNVVRVDTATGWSQQLRINWQAWQ